MECTKYQLCVHSFLSTCPDSLIMNTICNHIHLVMCSTQDRTALKTRVKGRYCKSSRKLTSVSHLLHISCLQNKRWLPLVCLLHLKCQGAGSIYLKLNVKAPANKNMETRPRFWSTEKCCCKAKVRLER